MQARSLSRGASMRRIVLSVGSVPRLVLSSAHPQGQRGPTISEDLKAALASGARVRVIVQAEEDALSSLRFRLGRGLRRQLAGALSLDVTASRTEPPRRRRRRRAPLRRPAGRRRHGDHQPGHARRQGLGRARAACLACSSQPRRHGQRHRRRRHRLGHRRAHRAHRARGRARQPRLARAGRHGRSVRPRHAHRGHDRRQRDGRGARDAGVRGRQRARRALRRRPRARQQRQPATRATSSPASTGRSPTPAATASASSICRSATRSPSRPPPIRCAAPSLARSQAGLVVVVSAGNYGQTATGTPVLGGITSPATRRSPSPSARSTRTGTVDRSRRLASRPTARAVRRSSTSRSSRTSSRPAPRIVSLENPASWLSTRYPDWHVAGSGRNAYYRLSGTSMSAAVVSGGVALLLDSEPGLTPAQVKMALQTGAQFLPEAGLIGGGAGSVDFSASQRLAQGGLVGSTADERSRTLLGLTGGASYRDTGSLIERIYDRTGIRLLSLLDLQALLGDADGPESDVLNLLGLSNPLGTAAPNYIVWGNVAGWSEQLLHRLGQRDAVSRRRVHRLGHRRLLGRVHRLGHRRSLPDGRTVASRGRSVTPAVCPCRGRALRRRGRRLRRRRRSALQPAVTQRMSTPPSSGSRSRS